MPFSTKFSKNHKCLRCGKPVSKKNTIHVRCRSLEENVKNSDLFNAELSRAEHRLREELFKKTVKHWNAKMGKKKLKNMFPDMEDRI